MSHSASNSQVFEVSKIVLTFFIMSEARWMAVENVVFFRKRSIVIKLPVKYHRVCKKNHPSFVMFMIRSAFMCKDLKV